MSGITDLTEGKYGHDDMEYEWAQQRQAEYILDELRCDPGDWLLDIGCGYGRILAAALERDLLPVGITVSQPQVEHCKKCNLHVHLMNYVDIASDWTNQFGGIVANGSLEHFVQVEEAAAGKSDEIYRKMFDICRTMISGPGKRFVTTAIHWRKKNQFDAAEIMRGPQAFKRGSPEYHCALLATKSFGGWYPYPGQLSECAKGKFRLVKDVDGTHDYHLTSEYWLRQMMKGVLLRPRIWFGLMARLLHDVRATKDMLRSTLIDQSWMWQFRGNPPPMILYRHTWEAY